jgi:hypothetical protein
VSASQLVARIFVAGTQLPVRSATVALDEGWAPRAAVILEVPWTPARVAALNPRANVRVTVVLERRWSGTLTLDDLSLMWVGLTLANLSTVWAGLTLNDLSAAWTQDWGNGTRATDTLTADLILRERQVDHGTATITVRATSDELLAQDAHALVDRGAETLASRLLALLAAGHIPVGPPPDFTAGAPFGVPAHLTEWSQSIWDAMEAAATSVGLKLFCDELRVWRLTVPNAAPTVTFNLPQVIEASDRVDRDGDYADVIVWIGVGINSEGLVIRETRTEPAIPAGPYRAVVFEQDYGQVGAGLPMPSFDELATRLALLQTRARVLTLTAPADPTVRPGQAIVTGVPSLDVTHSVVARVEFNVPADTMTITTRSTQEVV